jgi:hypothetical protein
MRNFLIKYETLLIAIGLSTLYGLIMWSRWHGIIFFGGFMLADWTREN